LQAISNQPSTYGQPYTKLPLDFTPLSVSSVAESSFDALFVLGNGHLLNSGLYTTANLLFEPSSLNNAYNSTGTIELDVGIIGTS
jgi:hypothetical protein